MCSGWKWLNVGPPCESEWFRHSAKIFFWCVWDDPSAWMKQIQMAPWLRFTGSFFLRRKCIAHSKTNFLGIDGARLERRKNKTLFIIISATFTQEESGWGGRASWSPLRGGAGNRPASWNSRTRADWGLNPRCDAKSVAAPSSGDSRLIRWVLQPLPSCDFNFNTRNLLQCNY